MMSYNFLQRIINGGGRIEREYGFGRERTDLLVIWFYGEGQVQEVVIALKIKYGKLEKTIDKGLAQTGAYMDQCGTSEGHLVIFDRAPDKAWEEKIIALKIKYGKLEKTIDKGLAQTGAYMDQCGTSEGHLVIFDRAPDKAWEEKIFRQERVYQGQDIVVWGM